MTDQQAGAPVRAPTAVEQQATTIAKADLTIDEGNVPYLYFDSEGFATIGIGILIDKRAGGHLLPEEIDFIFQNRVAKVLDAMRPEAWYPAVASDAVRLAAIMNMQFQLGTGSDEAFAASFACIGRRDWAGAARNLRASLWAKQTPKRAARVIAMIETGRHP